MASDGNPGGNISPEEIIAPHLGPIAEAVAEVEEAQRIQAVAEAKRQKADDKLAAAGESVLKATERLNRLRAAGKAGLATVDDFPAAETLRAQMKIDGHEDRFEEIESHIAAMNTYAAAENSIIAVAGPMNGERGSKLIHFIRPYSEKENPAVTVARDGTGHYLGIGVQESYGLDYAVPKYTDLEHSEMFGQTRTEVSIDEITFVSDADQIERLFEERQSSQGAPEGLVIYGSEAVSKYVELLAARTERLRPALYGVMRNMGERPKIPPVSYREERKRAEEAFRDALDLYVEDSLSHMAHGASMHVGPASPLMTKEMQEFLGITDREVFQQIMKTIGKNTQPRLIDGSALVNVGLNQTAESAWKGVWEGLRSQGFDELVDAATYPERRLLAVATLEHDALEKRLTDGTVLSRVERKQFRRALKRRVRVIDIAEESVALVE